MSDRSRDAAGNDSSEDAGTPQPGGGPTRVVSDESVDDILASLDETTGADSSDGDAVTAVDDASEPDETDDTAKAGETDETNDTDGIALETDAPDDFDPGRGPESDSDTTNSIDSAASSLPDDPGDASSDELSTRIERGDVTGADVRAAEAGDGREATPEIDEIELSMDDLEATETATTGRDDYPEDAGPLAGSIDDADSSSADNASQKNDASQEDDPGLIGRIRRLFSR